MVIDGGMLSRRSAAEMGKQREAFVQVLIAIADQP
jgi:hypothetical protein